MGCSKFTFNVIHFIAIFNGIAPQIRKNSATKKIKFLETTLFFIVPVAKLAVLIMRASRVINKFLRVKVPSIRILFSSSYEASGIMLFTLGILRASKMQGIFSYMRTLVPNKDPKPSWTFMLVWLTFLVLFMKISIMTLGGIYIKSPNYVTLNGYLNTLMHDLRYIDMTMSLMFIGSILYLYECGCKRVLNMIDEGHINDAMLFYTELVRNFAIFADAYKFEVVNTALFHTIWLIEMTSQILNIYSTFNFVSPRQIILQFVLHFIPKMMTIVTRFVYTCVAASSLKLQREEVLEQLMLLKIKNLQNSSLKPRYLSYDQIDIWIEIVKYSNFDLSGVGIFVLDREFLSSLAELTLSYIIITLSSKQRSKEA